MKFYEWIVYNKKDTAKRKFHVHGGGESLISGRNYEGSALPIGTIWAKNQDSHFFFSKFGGKGGESLYGYVLGD